MEDPRASLALDPAQRRDLLLVDRARSGDLDAFNDIVACYQDQLFGLVARIVPDRDQAYDVVQEAFFSAYRALGGFRGGPFEDRVEQPETRPTKTQLRNPASHHLPHDPVAATPILTKRIVRTISS